MMQWNPRRFATAATQPLVFALLAIVVSPQTARGAQSAPRAAVATGSLTGRVENSATGQYLHNARVAVKGSDLVTFTDESGTYRFANAPAGNVTLEVFYTGMAAQTITVSVPTGGIATQNVDLGGSAAEASGTVVRLGKFVVAAQEMDAETIATNEQRFSPNIKNVVAAGAFGDIAEGNVGEFMKFLPGVTADFADPTILSISVRGLNSHLTSVTSDGAQMANAHYGGSTRVFQFEQVSINNISRVELTKVPTPSQPADTLGGTVNMVSKSAFERKKAQLTYRLYLTANQGDLTFKQVPHSFETKEYRVLPSADFNYTLPVNDRFGVVVSGLSSNQFNDAYVSAKVYNATAVGTGATFARPYLQQHILQDSPRYTNRDSGSLKADWRVTPNSVLSVGGQLNKFWTYYGMHQMTSNAGTVATPSVAGGMPLTFGPDFTSGATGRGGITLDGQFFNIRGTTKAGNARYRFDDGDWKIEGGASMSESRTYFRDTDRGHFFNVTSALNGPLRLVYSDVSNEGPGRVETFNNANQPIDWRDINNYRLTGARSSLRTILDEVRTLDLSVRRQFDRFSFPLAVQFGAAQRYQERDTRREEINRTYLGPDGSAATADSAAPFAAQVYANRDASFGFSGVPWSSPHRAWEAYQENPRLFTKTAAQQVAEETFRITNSERFQETVDAAFFQTEFRLFRNRLNVLTGVRYEKTTGKGQGALLEPSNVFVRNANGTFAHNAAGQRIRRPEAGAAGSLEELRLTRTERGARAKKTYDGYHPSVHLTYNVTDNFLTRLAYAKTYGRPNFNQIIPNATVNDLDEDNSTDPNALPGTISLRNPGLKPWTADNFDLTFEYYSPSGGLLGVGAFRKDVQDFFGNAVTIATEADLIALDLDPRYVGWQITTQRNFGHARMSGIEVNVKHSLGFLGPWGRMFEVFANGTKLDLDAETQPSFGNIISGSANWGVTFTRRPLVVMAKWNYRGLTRGTRIPGVGALDGYQWDAERTTVDVNVDYRLTPWVALFANARNALGENPAAYRYGGDTPEYAKQFRVQRHGGQYAFGIKGTF
ncbi:MAG: TonB-dependent receptor [Opitutaceae bacterium]|nr:TonB-dependent receptor [Opitutaceae bacterium]